MDVTVSVAHFRCFLLLFLTSVRYERACLSPLTGVEENEPNETTAEKTVVLIHELANYYIDTKAKFYLKKLTSNAYTVCKGGGGG